MAFSNVLIAVVALALHGVEAHTVLTYPGWRGDNLKTNSSFPFGMQWQYPCGGIGVTQNRTYWPTTGGAVAFQPGWFAGHSSALMYVNLGLGEEPKNYSMPMVPMFQILGPSDGPYPGTVCLPQVQLPDGLMPKEGDKASIQLLQTAKHGAVTYNCVDIIFTDDKSKLPELNEKNCFNSTDIKVSSVDVVSQGTGANSSSGSPGASQTSSSSSAPSPTFQPSAAKKRESGRWSGLVSFLLML